MENFWDKLIELINKNERNQSIACFIGSIIGAYLSVVVIFITLKSHGLAAGMLGVTALITVVATIVFLAIGITKLEEYFCKY